MKNQLSLFAETEEELAELVQKWCKKNGRKFDEVYLDGINRNLDGYVYSITDNCTNNSDIHVPKVQKTQKEWEEYITLKNKENEVQKKKNQ